MKEIINPLATVELIAPLVDALLNTHEDDEREDEHRDTLLTLHQLIFPSTWKEPFTNLQAVEHAKRFMAI